MASKAGLAEQFLILALLVLFPFASFSQDSPAFQPTGTAVNTTDPDNPVAAPIQMVVRSGVCKLAVSPPLTGSGTCYIKTFDEKTGRVDIVSIGPPTIEWTGTLKGNFASGVYKIDVGAQSGYFYLALAKTVAKELPKPSAVLPPRSSGRTGCSPAIESSINGEVQGWSGETIFKLDNGQIWQQAEYDYTYFYEYHPEVTIYETKQDAE